MAVARNSEKSPLFTTDERIELIRAVTATIPNVRVVTFTGLLADAVSAFEVSAVIRGLRAVSDFEYEFLMASTNRAMEPKIESVFFMTSDKYSFLSSSIVKEVASKNGSYLSHFVTPNVEKALREKFRLM